MQSAKKHIIVLGTYRSGSSCLAGVLSKLGIDFGPCLGPAPHNPKGYFEHVIWRKKLIALFQEATATQIGTHQEICAVLSAWRHSLVDLDSQWVGLKHPLFCVVGNSLRDVFENGTAYYIAIDRPVAETVDSLVRCNWRWTRGMDLQFVAKSLIAARERFLEQVPYYRVDFHRLLKHPDAIIDNLVDFLKLEADQEQCQCARAFVEESLCHSVSGASHG